MADNLPRISITPDWQSVNALTSISVGVALKIQHIGGVDVDLALAATIPTSDIGERIENNQFFFVPAGENALWAKTAAKSGGAVLSVQDNT